MRVEQVKLTIAVGVAAFLPCAPSATPAAEILADQNAVSARHAAVTIQVGVRVVRRITFAGTQGGVVREHIVDVGDAVAADVTAAAILPNRDIQRANATDGIRRREPGHDLGKAIAPDIHSRQVAGPQNLAVVQVRPAGRVKGVGFDL